MYKITVFVENKENPMYKKILNAATNNIFGSLNKILGNTVSVGMNSDFANEIGSFFSFDNVSEEITIKEIVVILNAYEEELKKLYNITGFYYRIEKTDVNESPPKNENLKQRPIVFTSAKDKVEQFQKELKDLLIKYDAELVIEDFGREWASDEQIVVSFAFDENLASKTNEGSIPDWVIGRWLDTK